MGGVSADIPMLVGLDFLDRYSLVVDSVENVLESVLAARKPNSPENSVTFIWSSSLADKSCTQKRNEPSFIADLVSANKLYHLLKRVKPLDLPTETLGERQKFVSACFTCQKTAVTQL
jgi:hypothetical protein